MANSLDADVERMIAERRNKPDPRISVFCLCGAQWHGRYAVNNPVIEDHAARCGPPAALEEYEAAGHRAKFPRWWTAAPALEGLGNV
jgi:hypothetical protein